jgi:hypothetical protein
MRRVFGFIAASFALVVAATARAEEAPPAAESSVPWTGYASPLTGSQVALNAPLLGQEVVAVGVAPAPGYRSVRRVRTGLIIGGAVLFTVFYGFAVFDGIITEANRDGCQNIPNGTNGCYAVGDALFVPVLGPFIDLARIQTPASRAFDLADGLIQAGGVAMIVVGATVRRTVVVAGGGGGDRLELTLAPVVSPGRLGLVGTF